MPWSTWIGGHTAQPLERDILGLSGVLYRVEILLGVSMDARISADGRVREVKNISTEKLLAVIDEAEKMSLEGAVD